MDNLPNALQSTELEEICWEKGIRSLINNVCTGSCVITSKATINVFFFIILSTPQSVHSLFEKKPVDLEKKIYINFMALFLRILAYSSSIIEKCYCLQSDCSLTKIELRVDTQINITYTQKGSFLLDF